MTQLSAAPASAGLLAVAVRTIRRLDEIPYRLLALPLRFTVATVFWNSAMAKLADWNATLFLFREEYRLPVLPPELAAWMAVSIEIGAPILLVLGLLTRPTAAVLLGMTAVIQLVVYPQAWPTHIQWAAMLCVLPARGPGAIPLDGPLRRRVFGER